MGSAVRVLLLLLALTRCRSFLFVPPPLVPGAATKAAPAPAPPAATTAGPERASYRHSAATAASATHRHRGPSSRLESSGRSSPEDMDKVRQRLIASSNYQKMIDRVEGNSPFTDTEKSRGVEEAVEEPPVVPFLRQAVRAAVDVAIVLVPVGLVVAYGKVPPPVLEALTSAASAIKASPLEPVLGALPWEPILVLKSVAIGGVAILLSPVADRLVVSPAIHLWAQARLRSLSS